MRNRIRSYIGRVHIDTAVSTFGKLVKRLDKGAAKLEKSITQNDNAIGKLYDRNYTLWQNRERALRLKDRIESLIS